MNESYFKHIFSQSKYARILNSDKIVIWDTECKVKGKATPDIVREWYTKIFFSYWRYMLNLFTGAKLSIKYWSDEINLIKNPLYCNTNISHQILEFIKDSEFVLSYGSSLPDQKRLECVLDTVDNALWINVQHKFIDLQPLASEICIKGYNDSNPMLLPMKNCKLKTLSDNLIESGTSNLKYELPVIEGKITVQARRDIKCEEDVLMLANLYSLVKKFSE